MTPAEIESILTAHRCYPWPRNDPDHRGRTLATIRCDTCGELVSSTSPLPPGQWERTHQSMILARELGKVNA